MAFDAQLLCAAATLELWHWQCYCSLTTLWHMQGEGGKEGEVTAGRGSVAGQKQPEITVPF